MKRFVELDILRFLAASAVVVYHVAPRIGGVAPESGNAFGTVSRYGYLGVDLFFIISGYVILMSTRGRDWRTFLVQRAVRLFPSFWLALSITTLAVAVESSGARPSLAMVMANATMLPGYLGHEPLNPVFWTLGVEWKFYFIIAMLLATPLRSHMEHIACIWLVVLAVQFLGFDFKGLASASMFPYGSYFAFGMLLFCIHEGGLNTVRIAFSALSVSLSVATALRVLPGFIVNPLLADRYVVAGIIAVTGVVFLYLVLREQSIAQSATSRLLGATTYPLYLLHGVVAYPILQSSALLENSATRLLLASLALAGVTYAFATQIELRFVPWLSRRASAR